MDEEWRDIDGFSKYEVSNKGRVRNRRTGRILAQVWNGREGSKYLKVSLRADGQSGYEYPKLLLVHVLVLKAFKKDKSNTGMQGLHGPNGKSDNSINNLYWGTTFRNHGEDRRRDNTALTSSKHHQAVLNEDKVLEILKARGVTSQDQLADYYGVCQATISNIWNRKTWRHVKVDT